MPDYLKGETPGRAPTPGYSQQFATPGSLQDEDDSGEDDDEEDIGKDMAPQQKALDYDSDEKDDGADAQQELISLDGGNKRKKVPKLKKPGK